MDLSKVHRMTEKDMRKWEQQRQRGYKWVRRQFYWMTLAGYVVLLLILSLLLWLKVVPRDPAPIWVFQAYAGVLILPFFFAYMFGPMIWQLQEMMYYATLKGNTETETDPGDTDVA